MYNTVIMGFFIMGHVVSIDSEDLKSIAKQVNEIDNRTTGMEAMFPQFIETLNKTNEILVQLAVKDERDANTQRLIKDCIKKIDKHDAKISQNEKQIAKYSLLFAILVGFLVRFFPELKAIVGL